MGVTPITLTLNKIYKKIQLNIFCLILNQISAIFGQHPNAGRNIQELSVQGTSVIVPLLIVKKTQKNISPLSGWDGHKLFEQPGYLITLGAIL